LGKAGARVERQSVSYPLAKRAASNFLNATDCDHDSAVELYLWNAEISAAFLGALQRGALSHFSACPGCTLRVIPAEAATLRC
jgi:hypothetical protein